MNSKIKDERWSKFENQHYYDHKTGFLIDYSNIKIPNLFIEEFSEKLNSAYSKMQKLEKGELVNTDEKRMVGHYWLRNPALAPNKDIQKEIESTINEIKEFSKSIINGEIVNKNKLKFENFILIGIGGSALGPQFVNKALGADSEGLKSYFIDNTDPQGITDIVNQIEDLSKTLVIVISKSGGTKETRNGALLVKKIMQDENLEAEKHFIAITCKNSNLDKMAESEKWLKRFYFWDWVGGRTSQTSSVGLLPASLQGIDIDSFLEGASCADTLTRNPEIKNNPGMILASLWYFIGEGKGSKDMVILPYSDRLELISKYLQQLIMESIGKEKDNEGNIVNQGISVFGNKGSTDQHAFVQQLRDGLNNFFVTFVEVSNHKSDLKLKNTKYDVSNIEVEEGITATDYLSGFLHGTKKALTENNRANITLSIKEVSPFFVGFLIALFERAVGYYGFLVDVNSYNQPGVEAGKKAATDILELQMKVLNFLQANKGAHTIEEITEAVNGATSYDLFPILRNLSLNSRINVKNEGSDTINLFSKQSFSLS